MRAPGCVGEHLLRLATALVHTIPEGTLELVGRDNEVLVVARHRLDARLSPCDLRREVLNPGQAGGTRFLDRVSRVEVRPERRTAWAVTVERCHWCDGAGRAVIFGVVVACACRPNDQLGQEQDAVASSPPASSRPRRTMHVVRRQKRSRRRRASTEEGVADRSEEHQGEAESRGWRQASPAGLMNCASRVKPTSSLTIGTP